ncbi:hypothetical protein [Enterococcus casseliflavus]|uniref:hypothetical protein n=1 Tax=Enterococcus casseliflavus TaxID=37734 RepID=UPI0012E13C3E|nr:hypothetical protein [Enterococcus casseliflavus]MUN75759.1 hypothetical protein [Enterococcus casseliflavus]MUN97967.1 hypothetical protein [Enterococcus casseliflavus]
MEEEQFYMKYTRGYLVYVKDDNGRRVKVTWNEFFESYDPNKRVNFQDLVELIPVDEKYEKARDQMEIEKLIRRENEPIVDQLDLFHEYSNPIDFDKLVANLKQEQADES